MKSSHSLSLILPLYNEETLLESALNYCIEVLQADFEDFEIVLIDDGSKDMTLSILQEKFAHYPFIKIHQNYVNLNQGITVQRGWKIAEKDFVLFNGIDMPLDLKEVKEILEELSDNDVIVLERSIYQGATQWRLITSNVNFWIRKLLFPIVTSGFDDMNYTQIYKKTIIDSILPLAKSPAFTTPEMIIRARINGLKIAQKMITFNERKHGTGSLGKLHDILWTIYDMFRFKYLLTIGINKHGKVK
jgi:glycosyltransferase involved in cell wall biosynthesis